MALAIASNCLQGPDQRHNTNIAASCCNCHMTKRKKSLNAVKSAAKNIKGVHSAGMLLYYCRRIPFEVSSLVVQLLLCINYLLIIVLSCLQFLSVTSSSQRSVPHMRNVGSAFDIRHLQLCCLSLQTMLVFTCCSNKETASRFGTACGPA